MSESKRNKQGESIKLPPELQEDLRRYIARYFDRGEKAPTRGKLLVDAWRFFVASTANAGGRNQPDGTGNGDFPDIQNEDTGNGARLVHSPQSQIKEVVTPEEWRWVSRTLHVVRGGCADAIVPLDTNLDSFVLLTNLLKGHANVREDAGIPPTPTNIQRHLGELRAAEEALGRELAKTQEYTGDPGKTRKAVRETRKGNS